MQWECPRSGFEMRLLRAMTHVKAMRVDCRRLVLGSSVARVDLVRSHVSMAVTAGWSGHARRAFMEITGAALAHVSVA